MIGKTGVPCQFNARLDPNFALFSFTSNMNMPLFLEIKAEEADSIRAVWNRNTRHKLNVFEIPYPCQFPP